MSEQSHPKLEKIIALCRRRPHFSVQAYLFMLDVVGEASQGKTQSDSGSSHLTGQELLEQARELLLERFGCMAYTVLQFWGVSRTEDFGEIIFDLVAQDILSVSPDDTINDFANGFDFTDALVKPFQALGACPPLPQLD